MRPRGKSFAGCGAVPTGPSVQQAGAIKSLLRPSPQTFARGVQGNDLANLPGGLSEYLAAQRSVARALCERL